MVGFTFFPSSCTGILLVLAFFFFSDLSLRIIRLKGTNIKFSKHNTQWKVKEMTLLFFLRVSKALKETTLLASPKIQLAKITLSAHD